MTKAPLLKKPNSNFFPPNQAELNPDNLNAHNSFLAKNQHWTQAQASLFRQKYSTIPLDQHEIAQQILIGLWQVLLSYDPTKGVPFRTFATQTTIRQNLSLHATLQRNNPNPNQPRTLADTLKANPPTPPQIPPEILDLLPSDNQAQTVQLLYQGYTYEEIGKLLEFKSKSKVSNLLQKIRQNKAFRKALSAWIADKNNKKDPRI